MDLIRILLVDDEEVFLKVAKTYLEKIKENFKITIKEKAKEALEIIEKEDFDVIISDYQMPEMNGLEFLIQLKEKRIEIPFIIDSSFLIKKNKKNNQILSSLNPLPSDQSSSGKGKLGRSTIEQKDLLPAPRVFQLTNPGNGRAGTIYI